MFPLNPMSRWNVVLISVSVALLLSPTSGSASFPNFVSGFRPFGLTSDAFSTPRLEDIDADGDLDMFVGDYYGVIEFYENRGSSTLPAFAPGVRNPFGLSAVSLRAAPEFADLDDDGDLDLLIGDATGTLNYFENVGLPTAPWFVPALTQPVGLTDVGDNASPAFVDIEGDGDADLFVGHSAGGFKFFKNAGTPSSALFEPAVDEPYGLWETFIDSSPDFADIDGDGDFDMIHGPAEDGHVGIWENVGAPSLASFTPILGVRYVPHDAAPTFADLDGDGDQDLFIGTSGGAADGLGIAAGHSTGDLVYFENVGSASVFDLDTYFVLSDAPERIEGHSGMDLVDIDADGDLDLLQGWEAVTWYENLGTPTNPSWSEDSAATGIDLPIPGLETASTFGDLDGDGDFDALVGDQHGVLWYFENAGTPTSMSFDTFVLYPFGLSDVGEFGTPVMVDIDADGDLDVFVGNEAGDTLYFKNEGTPTAPAFDPPDTNPFGLANVFLGPVGSRGAYPEFVDIDLDGDFDAFIGNHHGNLIYFENEGTSVSPEFRFTPIVRNPFGLANMSVAATVAFGDLDDDGDPDALLGDASEYVAYFENVAPAPLSCSAVPLTTCYSGFDKGLLLVNEKKVGKEKLIAKFTKGPELVQEVFGDPTTPSTGTRFALCVYDAGPNPYLVGELTIERAGETCGTKPCWKSIGGSSTEGKGFTFKDKEAASSGVTKMVLKSGAEGKSSIILKAANNAAKQQTALPTGMAAALGQSTEVRLQLIQENGLCYDATLSDVSVVPGLFVKAK